jgi:hypothetical protein
MDCVVASHLRHMEGSRIRTRVHLVLAIPEGGGFLDLS